MSDESRRILDLLAQGKITVDEADQLLRALNSSPPEAEPAARFLRIEVHKPAAEGRREKHVNIRVPVALVRGGMRLGAIIPGYVGDDITRRLRERGIDVDLSKLNQDELDRLLKNFGEMTVDVDRGKAQVRITCE